MKVMLTVGPMKTANMECEVELPDGLTDAEINRSVRGDLAFLREQVVESSWVRMEEP